VCIFVLYAKNKKRQGIRQTSDAIVPAECARSRSSELAKVSLKVAIFRNSLPFLSNTVIQLSNIKNKRSGLTWSLLETAR
jgi:hypothetical protein